MRRINNMIGDLAKRGVTEESANKVCNPYARISLNDFPLCDETDLTALKTTDFRYTLRYKPAPNKIYKNKMFIISCDLIDDGVGKTSTRVIDYKDLVERAKTHKSLAWLIRNTNISPALFKIAKTNPGMIIPIACDIPKYFKKIGDKSLNLRTDEENAVERARLKHYFESNGITDVEV
jgi:hypothetical protein